MAYYAEGGVETIINKLLARVTSQYSAEVRAALLGYDTELDKLLERLPGTPAPNSLIGQKVSVWIDIYKAELAIAQVISGILQDRTRLDGFIIDTLERIAQVPEDDEDDFHPSRLLLSASLRVDMAQSSGQATDYNAISRQDSEVWRHPMVEDESATSRWWKSGRTTPVPKILRPYHPPISVKGAAEPRPSQVNPMILEQPLPHRPQASFPLLAYQTTTPAHGMAGSHAGAEEIVDAEDTATRLKVKIEPSTARVPSKSHRRSSRVKSNEWVDSDEDSEDMEPVREPSRKGKGKQRAASDDDEMDVDEPVEQEKGRGRGSRRLLAVSTESKTRRGHVMVKRSESRPPTDDGAQEDSHDDAVPASVPCTLCTRRRKECLFMPGKFACVACRKGKSKCSGVPESWRDRLKAQEPLQEPEVRSRSRQRSTSRPPKSKKAQPPPRSRPEAQKRTEDTDAEPAVGGSTAVVVKKGKKVRPTKPHPIQPLGQVPSQYVYLLSRQGEAVSKGIRVETDHIGLDGEGKVGSELHERVKKLEEENAGLRENIAKQAIEVEQLKTMVGIVMATLNGHTALLEGQRIVLKELEEHGMKLDNAGDTEGSTFGAIPIPPPSTPLSKARPLQYPSSSLFQGRTSPTHPVKDPAVYWNSGISPSSSLVQEFVETSAYPAGVALSPALSNRPHSPRVEIEDEPMAESPE